MEEEGLEEWEEVFRRLECLHEESREYIKVDKLVSAVMDLNKSTMSYWWRGGIPMKRFEVENLFRDADSNGDGLISLQEFSQLWSKEDLFSRSLRNYITKSLKTLAYAKDIKKCPPPLFNFVLSCSQILIFILSMHYPNSVNNLHFKRNRAWEVWRYFSYCLVHSDTLHLSCVLSMEIFIGLMMETVHGWLAVAAIYMSGVVSGSLGYGVFGQYDSLVGGSAGCYALIAAQLATLILNWHEDHAIVIRRARSNKPLHVFNGNIVRILKMVGLFLFIFLDVVLVVSVKDSKISVVAHLFGFIGGFLSGLLAVKNRKVDPWEKRFQRIVMFGTGLYFLAAVLSNFAMLPMMQS